MIRLHGANQEAPVELYPTLNAVGLIEDLIDNISTNPEQYESYVVMMIGYPSPDSLKGLIDRLVSQESADPDRVYIYGFSAGGWGTSDFIKAYPDAAAAAVMICGANPPTSEQAKKLVNLPIRLYHSDDDNVVSVEESRQFYKQLRLAGSKKVKYYETTGLKHDAWLYAYKTDMLEWMFAQNRGISQKTPPNLAAAEGWAHPGITEAYNKDLIPADLQSNYTDVITRAEFCRMAVKWVEYAEGKDINTILKEKGLTRRQNAFSDTADPDILAAYALGITAGDTAPTATAPGKFVPDGQFDRQSAAMMMYNTCRAIGTDVANPKAADFTDMNLAESWARVGIDFCRANTIMNGVTTTPPIRFDPQKTYTRQESIVMFNNTDPDALPGKP